MKKQTKSDINKLAMIFPKLQRFFHNLSIEVSRTGDFTIAQYRVLSLLDYYGKMTVNQLKKHLKIAQSSTSGIADRLEQSGYLKKYSSDTDRRVAIIELTYKAKKLLNRKMYPLDKVYRNILDKLDEEEQKDFVALFEKLLFYVEKIEKENEGNLDKN